MNIRQLGRSGLRVSELCLGAMTFGREADETASVEMLNHYYEFGGNFIDTADVYGPTPGISEEILGRWLKGRDRALPGPGDKSPLHYRPWTERLWPEPQAYP